MPPKKAAAAAGSKPSNKKQKLSDHPSSSAGSSDKILSKAEEEEMSSALIAQLLAQEGGGDQGYYAEYNNDASYGSAYDGGDYSDDDDDYRNDYNYRPKSRSKRGAGRGRKRAKPAAAPPPPPAPTKPTPSAATTTTTTTAPTKALESTISTALSKDETVAVVSSTEASEGQDATKTKADAVAATPSAPVDTLSAPVATLSAPVAPATPVDPPAAPKPKKVKEVVPVFNTGMYSEKEENAFVEALELFGRNWRSVEDHVATRDSNSIRSHAQKHFIKLFRDNIPLPAKVLVSGPGYTLSGKDLDPYSSAARPYLSQRVLDDPSLLPSQGGTIFTPESGAMAKAEKAQAKEKKAAVVSEKIKDRESVMDAVKEMKELKIRKPVKLVKESSRDKSRADSPPAEPAYTGRTDYSKARLRNVRERTSISFRQMATDLDPLTMVKCEPFCGQPNSGVQGCQPFGIKVQSNVLLGMDFHAHLMTSEIIGFLAGEWDAASKNIHIKAIFPCRSLPLEQNHINVEMDPTSEFEVRQEIEKRNMKIVGWYHSHPTFTPDPSLVDIENQTSYQSLFKDESMNEEPFVGAIVGPYDERLPGLSSVINWFYISQAPQERGHPKRLLYDLIEDLELPEEEAASWTKLFDEYRDSPERTNFKEQWRQEESETKLQKMLVSLGRRMPWLRNTLLKCKDETDSKDDVDANGTHEDDNVAVVDSAVVEDIVSQEQVTGQEEGQQPATEDPIVTEAAVEEKKTDETVSTTHAGDTDMEASSTAMEGVEPSGQEDAFEATMASDLSTEHSLVRSLSNASSSGSSASKSFIGLGGLINDPFLLRVEQELTTWESVVG
ncbi:hypothetical protein BGZ98_006257 [Dissophora globulifera]|nr:hypothetical protein BGZ98_006257 [Dissophora globulifera]